MNKKQISELLGRFGFVYKDKVWVRIRGEIAQGLYAYKSNYGPAMYFEMIVVYLPLIEGSRIKFQDSHIRCRLTTDTRTQLGRWLEEPSSFSPEQTSAIIIDEFVPIVESFFVQFDTREKLLAAARHGNPMPFAGGVTGELIEWEKGITLSG